MICLLFAFERRRPIKLDIYFRANSFGKVVMSISPQNESLFPLQNLSYEKTECYMTIYNIYIDNIGSIYYASVVLCVIDAILGIVAVMSNGLIMRVILSKSTLHSPSNFLLCCLAVADFLTGAITLPAFVVSITARSSGAYSVYCKASLASYFPVYFLSGVSFLTLTTITVERFLALQLHLRYQQLITIRRVLIVEAAIWIFLISIVTLPAYLSYGTFEVAVAGVVAFSLVANALFYTAIAFTARRHLRRVIAEEELTVRFHGKSAVETRKVRRSSKTIAGILLVCCVCYVPTICVMVTSVWGLNEGRTPRARLVRDVAASFVFANSAINPLLLCYRVTEIRQAVISSAKTLIKCR